jgi:actin-related protein 5
MSELLFESYDVPSVCYGIDALFSFHANNLSFDEGGIVASSGHTTTHVIPIIGRGVLEHTKRYYRFSRIVYYNFFLRK